MLGRGLDHRDRRQHAEGVPNFGGTLPNDVFVDILGMPTPIPPARSTPRTGIC
jgi:hypothetical protein